MIIKLALADLALSCISPILSIIHSDASYQHTNTVTCLPFLSHSLSLTLSLSMCCHTYLPICPCVPLYRDQRDDLDGQASPVKAPKVLRRLSRGGASGGQGVRRVTGGDKGGRKEVTLLDSDSDA